MTDNDLKIVEQMETYGGSFVKALAEAAKRADPVNLAKIKATFSDYWQQYTKMAGVKNTKVLGKVHRDGAEVVITFRYMGHDYPSTLANREIMDTYLHNGDQAVLAGLEGQL